MARRLNFEKINILRKISENGWAESDSDNSAPTGEASFLRRASGRKNGRKSLSDLEESLGILRGKIAEYDDNLERAMALMEDTKLRRRNKEIGAATYKSSFIRIEKEIGYIKKELKRLGNIEAANSRILDRKLASR